MWVTSFVPVVSCGLDRHWQSLGSNLARRSGSAAAVSRFGGGELETGPFRLFKDDSTVEITVVALDGS